MKYTTDMKLNDDAGRVAALQRYDILELGPQKEFEEIVTLLKSIFSVPFAAINLIDAHRSWMTAGAGMECADFPREDTFCDVTIQGDQVLAVEDATLDSRFADNPFVTGEGHIQCYIGAPLTTPEGYNIGAICLLGQQARQFTEGEKAILKSFAKVVVAQLELRHSAAMDGLTGAMSRRAFEDRLGRAPVDARCTLLMFDIDHFKSVNDTYGHQVGDDVLRGVAAAARSSLRQSDVLGRLGGEEFAVLLKNTSVDDAAEIAERLNETVAAFRYDILGHSPVTVSIGVAEHAAGETIQEWLKHADKAMYHAKRSGRNRVVKWPIAT